MNCILKKSLRFFLVFSFCAVYADTAFGQNEFEAELQKKTDSLMYTDHGVRDVLYPNSVLQSLTIPSGWGGYGTYIFGGIGGDYRQPYRQTADLISFAGFCIGDPQKFVNLAFSINNTDVSNIGNFSGNLTISRHVFTGSSISIGALQMFADRRVSDSPGYTVYFAFSHAIQSLLSLDQRSSKLSYTVGIGTGRFYKKSPMDVLNGKGKYGTGIFAGLSYETLKWMNVNLEWSGMNLGCSLGIKPLNAPLAIGLGITNLTRYSADKPNLSFAVSYPLSLKRN